MKRYLHTYYHGSNVYIATHKETKNYLNVRREKEIHSPVLTKHKRYP